TLDIDSLGLELSRSLECDQDRLSRAMATVLLPMSAVRASLRLEPDEFLKRLDEVILSDKRDWHEKNQSRWKGIAPAVGRLIAANGYFSLLHKAYQLLLNRPALVRGFKVLTELRPIYDDEVTATKAMLLSSTLVIDYEEGTAKKRLHLALDQ